MFSSVIRRAPLALRTQAQPVRFINIHEYQSKDLMNQYGVKVQKCSVVGEPGGAVKAAADLGAVDEYVVKAQVHAGGRGKGHFLENGFQGGVHLAKTAEQAAELAEKMLGKHLVTKQTTADGVLVQKVMIAQALDISKEFYFAILMDRAAGGPVMVASPEGGMDIEAVAEETPELIFKDAVNIASGLRDGQTLALAKKLGLEGAVADDAAEQMARLYNLFIGLDATQVEINPLVLTPTGDVVSFDAKISFDDNALFRQQAVKDMYDPAEEDPREVEAAKYDLNYVPMDGEIGCMVNGAGLAMATMDIISHYGRSPANFLDVGGSATQENIEAAFRLVRSDPNVKAILVNIFGGIAKCDLIAAGMVAASKSMKLDIPLIVRLEGTNVVEGKRILADSGLDIVVADNLDDAARKACASLD
eukprot:TRINITY_DN102_c0_g2_i1.p2 TRINITY_DN102_c0_g2~~TRINITY_DN102_c0_g2_i1.p2  ORF type:complete len:418 (-),score=235.07 TRINITY_DN102_c0_g2_i1:361-1614(-)